MNTAYYKSPFGAIEISSDEGYIVSLRIADELKEGNPDKLTDMTYECLCEFFSGDRTTFDLPIKFIGTTFQKKVWTALQKIPYGSTISYKQLAEAIGAPKAYRAVGSACGKNPVCIIVPCHRVIGSGGKITGYAYGIEMKRKLLELEKSL